MVILKDFSCWTQEFLYLKHSKKFYSHPYNLCKKCIDEFGLNKTTQKFEYKHVKNLIINLIGQTIKIINTFRNIK
jgi:hypothetical protein